MGADHSKPPPPKPGDVAAAKQSGAKTEGKSTARVQFDANGNPVWEWSIATGEFGREISTARLEKLEHPALSLADDAPTAFETVRPNPQGAKKGYDPYDSGKLGKRPVPVKKDLRKLSEFLKLKKQAANNKDEE